MSSSRAALAEAAMDVIRSTTAEHPLPRRAPSARSSRPAVLALIAGWLLLVWMWTARPAWIFGEKPVALSEAQSLAEARYALFLTHQRIETYREHNGALPAALSELPQKERGVQYRVEGNGYALASRVGSDSFVLTNRMNADSFLGNALQVLHGSH